jgi:hypothetical protein
MSSRSWTKALKSNGGNADGLQQPRVRIVARWVPLYCTKTCLRSSRIAINLAGIGVSVMDNTPQVSCAAGLLKHGGVGAEPLACDVRRS